MAATQPSVATKHGGSTVTMRGKAAAAKAEEGSRTRQQLLDIAEELFALHGPEAVSLRSVTTAAGLATGAVHYHFGTREDLVASVVARRGTSVITRSHDMIAELERSRARPTARQLLDTMAVPLVAVYDDDPVGGLRWLKLVARLTQSRDPAVLAGTGRLERRLDAQLLRAYPNASPEHLRRAWRIAAVMLVRMLGDADTPGAHLPGEESDGVSRDFIEAAIQFCADGLHAAGRRG